MRRARNASRWARPARSRCASRRCARARPGAGSTTCSGRGLGLEGAERVDPAGGEPAVDLGALLGQEAAGLRVVARPREIDLAVRGVEVADHQHAMARAAQLLDAARRARGRSRACTARGCCRGPCRCPSGSRRSRRRAFRSVRAAGAPRRRSAARRASASTASGSRRAIERDAAVAAPLRRRELDVPAAAARAAPGGISSGSARTSCSATMSACVRASQRSKPFFAQARRPFTFQVTMRSDSLIRVPRTPAGSR